LTLPPSGPQDGAGAWLAPAAALRRIAYLLEAERAETYKVQAFRRAAAAADAAGNDELGRLHRLGQLETLAGIGKTTASVIAEVLSGGTPSYLRALEDRAPQVSAPVEAVLRQLRGDCHSHSDWSDGGSPIEEMAAAAISLGHEYLALTDHSPRLTVAHGLSTERLLQQLDVLAALNSELAPFRILSGCEVDILEDGTLDQSDEILAALDVVVASVHSKLRMGRAEMTRRMVTAVSNPHVDVLGHCTGRIIVGRGRPQSELDPEAVFGACAAHGVAVEVNSRPERRDPPVELLRVALDKGCLVAVNSDAHAPGQLSWLRFGCEQLTSAGGPASRIVNALPLDELLSWTARSS
jgi:putative hydrolase